MKLIILLTLLVVSSMVNAATKFEMYRSIIHSDIEDNGIMTYGNAGGNGMLTMSGTMDLFSDSANFAYLVCNDQRCLLVEDTARIEAVLSFPENEAILDRNGFTSFVYYTIGNRMTLVWLSFAGNVIIEDWAENPNADLGISDNPNLQPERFNGTIDEAALLLRDEFMESILSCR